MIYNQQTLEGVSWYIRIFVRFMDFVIPYLHRRGYKGNIVYNWDRRRERIVSKNIIGIKSREWAKVVGKVEIDVKNKTDKFDSIRQQLRRAIKEKV